MIASINLTNRSLGEPLFSIVDNTVERNFGCISFHFNLNHCIMSAREYCRLSNKKLGKDVVVIDNANEIEFSDNYRPEIYRRVSI